jgi:hypothetical protein
VPRHSSYVMQGISLRKVTTSQQQPFSVLRTLLISCDYLCLAALDRWERSTVRAVKSQHHLGTGSERRHPPLGQRGHGDFCRLVSNYTRKASWRRRHAYPKLGKAGGPSISPSLSAQVIVVMMHPAPHLPLPPQYTSIFCPCHSDPLLRNTLQVNPC